MKMLRNIIDCESLEVTQGNVYDGVSCSNLKSLPCSDCNFTIKRTHQRFFWEYVPEPGCLKRNILRKKSVVDQRHNKVAVL